MRLGERERGPDLFAVVAGFRRRGETHVVVTLLGRATLVNGSQAQVARQAAGRGPSVHPGQLERDECEREVLRALDEPAMLRVQERRRDAAVVKRTQQAGLLGGPLVRIACALGHEPRDRAARNGAGRLHQHRQIVAISETPHKLAHIIPGKGLQGRGRFGLSGHRHNKDAFD